MNAKRWSYLGVIVAALCALVGTGRAPAANAPLGGFIPFVGIGLTRQFETLDDDPTGTFFIADPEPVWSGTPLGGSHFEIALLDTGAATHILTQDAASNSKFGIHVPYSGNTDGFTGASYQTIFGASGQLDLLINDPLGVYAAGLGPGQRISASGADLNLNTAALRGQSSFATLEAPEEWQLPNILGLPIAGHHSIAIRNSEPQIFQYEGRTVRTPNIEFFERGTGAAEALQMGITRRTNLNLHPTASFISGPFYLQNLVVGEDFEVTAHEDPLSPSVLDSAGIFVEIDATRGNRSIQDKEFLFDTGADLTVVSEQTAARLGFDVEFDQPDFVLEVEGAGGVSSGVPGFYLDELNIDTVGGSFTLTNVPIAVFDLPNPTEPANTIDGILGMHIFTGRNLIIDANPAANPAGGGHPRLYISDPVAETHSWATSAASGNWATNGNWNAAGTPNIMWDATVANVSGSNQTALVAANSTVYRMTVSGTQTAQMKVQINNGATLTTYGETLIQQGGRVELAAGGKLDAQFVNIEGGSLAGEGEIFVGTGPVFGQVRNLAGRVEPGDPLGELTIDGDFSQQLGGTLAIDLGGNTAITQYDHLQVERYAFLDGTLEVNLLSFVPAVNATFTILTAESGIFGEFENLDLPAGFQWDVAYEENDVILTVVGISAALDGDFNLDGKVDAADYVLWRKKGGSEIDYGKWRTNFGETQQGSGGNDFSGVPEPCSAVLVLLAACGLALSRPLTRDARSVTSTTLQ